MIDRSGPSDTAELCQGFSADAFVECADDAF